MPEQCNATIVIGHAELRCDKTQHGERAGHVNCGPGRWDKHSAVVWGDERLFWTDDWPGAVPHTPPCRDCEQSHRDWQQAILAQQEACRERDRARADADRYREALRWIADHPYPSVPAMISYDMKHEAREALEGVSRD